jgi:hypothetical protein
LRCFFCCSWVSYLFLSYTIMEEKGSNRSGRRNRNELMTN